MGDGAKVGTDWRAYRRLGRGLAIIGLTMAAIGLLPHAARAAGDAIEDPRATRVEGNATTCEDLGYPDDTQLSASDDDGGAADGITVTNDGTYIDVTVDGDIVIDVIVVKGGDAYNVYPGDVRDDLRSPVNGGGNIPAVSHWFLCYHEGSGDTTTTTTSTTTTEPDTTTTEPDTTTTTEEETTTTAGGSNVLAVSSTAPAQVLGEEETRVAADALPRTGSGSTAALVALGLLLLVIGGHASHKATLLLDGRR